MSLRRRLRGQLSSLAKKWNTYRSSSRIEQLAAIESPQGERLARVLRAWRAGDVRGAGSWKARIEEERQAMLRSNEPLLKDPGGAQGPWDQGKTVAAVCGVSKGPEYAMLLHLLVREFEPGMALEMGTNVGISASYQAAALQLNGKGELMTLDGSPPRVELAKALHQRLGLHNVTYVVGAFEDTLDAALAEAGELDYAFIDGHHRKEPTLAYFSKIWRHASEDAVMVFDDIRWSSGMQEAWKMLQHDERVKIAVDAGEIGICLTAKEPPAVERCVTAPILR